MYKNAGGDLHKIAKAEAKVQRNEAGKIEAKGGRKNKRCAKLMRKSLEFFENLPKDYFTNIMDAAFKKCAHK